MKLIIDINENVYKDLKEYFDAGNCGLGTELAIANGIPLEEIMSEMRVIKDKQGGVSNYRAGLKLALEIIDNHTYFLDKHISKWKGFDYKRGIYKEITDMICDINTREIKSHKTDEELDEWTDAWGHHMMQLLAELCTKDEYLNMFKKELKGENE